MHERILLSGGLDSATVLALRVASNARVDALHVDIGQPARHEERARAIALADHYDVYLHQISMLGLSVGVGEIPGRNLLLVSAALTSGLPSPAAIVLGIHAGTPYWDCGSDFVQHTQTVIDGYTGGAVQLLAPLQTLGKPDVVALAMELNVPLSKTYSCEVGAGPCGKCASCLDREAFR